MKDQICTDELAVWEIFLVFAVVNIHSESKVHDKIFLQTFG